MNQGKPQVAGPTTTGGEGGSGAGGGRWSQLVAINWAKALTIVLLLGLTATLGVRDMRQVLYLSLHISYCLWWLIEQWLFPLRKEQIFTERVGFGGFALALLFIGVLYALPGLAAFLNPAPIGAAAVALGLGLFIFGSLINATADVQKMTAKALARNERPTGPHGPLCILRETPARRRRA